MKEQLEHRLNELKTEFESGQKVMAELEVKRADLGKTLLRISGAIQVLEELLGKKEQIEENSIDQPGDSTENITQDEKPLQDDKPAHMD